MLQHARAPPKRSRLRELALRSLACCVRARARLVVSPSFRIEFSQIFSGAAEMLVAAALALFALARLAVGQTNFAGVAATSDHEQRFESPIVSTAATACCRARILMLDGNIYVRAGGLGKNITFVASDRGGTIFLGDTDVRQLPTRVRAQAAIANPIEPNRHIFRRTSRR